MVKSRSPKSETPTPQKPERPPKKGSRDPRRPTAPKRPNPSLDRLKMLARLGPIALLLLALGASGTYVWGRRQLETLDASLPDPTRITTFARPGTITIEAANGTILQQIGPVTHEKLKLSQIPETLVHAFLSAEDHRFYEHNGIDLQGIARAAGVNLQEGEIVEGASTITQQLARTVFLTQAPTLDRKIREARLAQKIEQELVKNDVLEYYLNLVYLGSGAYGVADAAWVFFSKTVDELTLAEMATIAGMPAAPSVYSPIVAPDIARRRRDLILDRMAALGYVSEAEAKRAKNAPLGTEPSLPKRLNVRLPYFTSYIEQELPKYVSPEQIEQGGLIVETTLDMDMQAHAEATVEKAIEQYGSWDGFEDASLVALDPRNGEIRALVGGLDFQESQFNFATQAKRQPGSTFKGLVYTAAIASGMSPTDSYEDKAIKIGAYQPKNANGRHAGWMSLDTALTQSVNTIAIQLVGDVGFAPTIALARDMGIESPLEEAYAMALGAYEVTLLEITGAYATLANAGKHHPPHGIRKIRNQAGEVLYDYSVDGKSRQAVDEDSAAIMTWMLRHVVSRGTGSPAQLPDRPVAGKTGTTDLARDLWFIGYIPQLAIGIWLGNEDNRPTYGASTTAARVWRDFAIEATENMEVIEFPEVPSFYYREASLERKPVDGGLQNASTRNGQSAETASSDDRDSEYSDEDWTDPDRYDYVQSGAGAGYVSADYGSTDAASTVDTSYGSDGGEPASDPGYGSGYGGGVDTSYGYGDPSAPPPLPEPEPSLPLPEPPALPLPAPAPPAPAPAPAPAAEGGE
ncbi:MAG: transglycosylase domain-containing protein [Geitlerinemataceae cyanobacterium]